MRETDGGSRSFCGRFPGGGDCYRNDFRNFQKIDSQFQNFVQVLRV